MKNKNINQTNLEFELFLNFFFAPVAYFIDKGLPDERWKTVFLVVFFTLWVGLNFFLIWKNKSKGLEKIFYILRVAGFFIVTCLFLVFLLYI